MDRAKILQHFKDYTDGYDSSDPKIKLKIDHTYRVAGLCDKIARSINLSEEEVDIAWLCGMLHDIGRFEQVRRYNTFIDSESIDHAYLGCMLLYGEEAVTEEPRRIDYNNTDRRFLREFIEDDSYDEYIGNAILCHSIYRVPEEYDDKMTMFCDILRDADKIDIYKACTDGALEDIYNVTSEELYSAEVSEEVIRCFDEKRTVPRNYRKSVVDHVVGHICLAFELVYPISKLEAANQGYVYKLAAFKSNNPVTEQHFTYFREKIKEYLEK